jgi:hypothetical protein
LGARGTKLFEQVILPQTTDVTEIPSVTFSFFDPGQKTFRTLSHPGIPLTVRSAGSVAAPTIAAPESTGDRAARGCCSTTTHGRARKSLSC